MKGILERSTYNYHAGDGKIDLGLTFKVIESDVFLDRFIGGCI
jgi:hypothetical protein